jgi:predicted MPP superfamily phosphohydrolase
LFQDPAEFRRRIREAGLRLLVNESASLAIRGVPVQLLGLRWGASDTHPHDPKSRGDQAIEGSMKELLPQRLADAFPILLAHHPHAFDFAQDIPLTLAGHTHGGQLMVAPNVGFGPMLYRYWSGLYQKGDRALVVSNGTGNWFPLRTRAPAEIVHLTLRRA